MSEHCTSSTDARRRALCRRTLCHCHTMITHYSSVFSVLVVYLFVAEAVARVYCRPTGGKDYTDEENATANCCENGGICVFRSFCYCQSAYTGRYCQYRRSERDCGRVLHGELLRNGCSLCQCREGRVVCFHNMLSGCDTREKQLASLTLSRANRLLTATSGVASGRQTPYRRWSTLALVCGVMALYPIDNYR